MNNYLGGWQPDLSQIAPRMNFSITKFVRSLDGLSAAERVRAVDDLFWDIEATLQSPHTQAIMKPGLRKVQSKILHMLSPVERESIRHEQQAWRGTRSHLRGNQLTNEQWRTFVDEEDPGRTNRPFLYGLQGRDYQGTLDARRARPIRQAQRSENPWIAHLRQFRAQNPDMPFREAMKAARGTYLIDPSRAYRPTIRSRGQNAYISPDGEVFLQRRQRVARRPRAARLDVAAAVPLSGAPPVDF